MDRPVISLLTDFGPEPAAICRGVMLGIARDAQLVEISSSVRKYAIRDGAFLLWCALPYLPVGTHVGVVDPGVGTERRPIALRTGRGDVLVGPDNGLLVPAAERLGGIEEARVLENRDLWLPVTSTTFHGRDIFSPVAAHLATGAPFASVGPELPVGELVRVPFPTGRAHDGGYDTSVVFVDSFGNVRLAGLPGDLAAAIGELQPGRLLRVEIAGRSGSGEAGPGSDGPAATAHVERVTWQRAFGAVEVGASLLYEDSFGTISLADNQGNIAARLGLVPDAPVRIVPDAD